MKFITLILCLALLGSCKNKEEKPTEKPTEIQVINISEDFLVEEEEEVSDEPDREEIVLDEDLQKLIPKYFFVFDVISGDLNNDGKEDYVLIIKGTDPDMFEENQFGKTVDRNSRGIIVALKEETGYRKLVENSSCFSSENEDGGVYYAPELWVSINTKNILDISYAHGRYGNWGYLFRYQNNTMELIGFSSNTNRGPVGLREVSVNFSTKKKRILENTTPDCEPGEEAWKETWENIKIDKLIKLQDIDNFDGLEF